MFVSKLKIIMFISVFRHGLPKMPVTNPCQWQHSFKGWYKTQECKTQKEIETEYKLAEEYLKGE